MFDQLLQRLNMNLAGLADRLRVVLASSLFQGTLVTVTLPASDSSVTAPHGLGRPHNGGFLVGASAAVTGVVLTATSNTEFTVSVPTTSVSDRTLKVWVF